MPQGWDWAAWTNTISATIAGAVVALSGSWWLDRNRSRREYEATLNQALSGILDGITLHLRDLADFEKVDDAWARSNSGPELEPELPAAYELGTRIKSARLIARRGDRVILRAAQDAFRAVIDRPSATQRGLLWKLGDVIQDWRAGNLEDPQHIFKRLRELALETRSARDHSPWDAF